MPSDGQPVRFDKFEVNLETGEVRRAGTKVRLQEQPFQVLAALLEKPGKIVTKQELQERIWKEDTFVDFDSSLATAINKVRQALGDSASHPRFVETVARRGYRFLGAIEPTSPPPRVAATNAAARLALFVVVGGVLVVAAGSFLLGRIGTETAQPPPAFVAQPVTSLRGIEIHPAISPGGDRVAFAHGTADRVGGFNLHIYVQTIGSDDEPVQITTDSQYDFSPTWSPDGNYLAFLRGYPGKAEIIRIPSIGGPGQKLGEAFLPAPISAGVALSYTFLDWSPDGKFLAVAVGSTQDDPTPHQLEIATGLVTPLPSPNNSLRNPAYAPDGRSLAYNLSRGVGNSDIWLQHLAKTGEVDGQPRRLTRQETWMFGLDWTPDGNEIVFISGLGSDRKFWRVSTEPSRPEIVQVNSQSGLQISIDPLAGRFIYSEVTSGPKNIWSLSGPLVATADAVAPKRLIASTLSDESAQISPDGESVVFFSTRTGSKELWTSSIDGTDLNRLTSLNGSIAGSPSWSPDGQFIAFDGNRDGPFDVYMVRLDGGAVRRVTASDSVDIRPSWSADGEWIYFLSRRSGRAALWKTPAVGGEAVQVTQAGGSESFELTDGSLYYFKNVGDGEIWRLSAGQSDGERILTGIESKHWAAFERGICFVSDVEQKPQTLSFYDFATTTVTRFAELPEDTRVDGSPGLSVSRDGRSVVVSISEESGSDIMLVEDFH
ncbi:MAG: winged helix-turn-helix domain-containing protein [Acidobacteria bacterium]|nr:winged helix-turn-helix domain-containing protein [Acidobacteriota bacterium]MDA1233368.1 winged helix-turn-helix domain-containing protein [Acidobacteriota bacterium]